MQSEFWTLNALPIGALLFGLIGLGVFWVAGKQFDKKYGKDGIPPK